VGRYLSLISLTPEVYHARGLGLFERISSKCTKETNKDELEGCLDDERQFKTAKRLVTPLFSNGFPRYLRHFSSSKRIAFLESVNFSTCVGVQIFNFRDGHVTTFRHHSGACICQIPGQTLQTSKRHTFRVSAFRR